MIVADREPVRTILRQAAEFIIFGLGLPLGAWATQSASSFWPLVAVLAGIYLALGALPCPWKRAMILVGVAAFFVPFGILGWVFWELAHPPIVSTLDELPGVLFGLQNLGVASLLCTSAVAGWALHSWFNHVRGRRTRG
jgi:hypothetical protein